MALNAKQEAFVAAYIGPARFVAVLAAQMAGYRGTPGSMRVMASRLLTNANIKAEVEAARAVIRAEGIASLEARIDAQNERWMALQQVVRERAARYGDHAAMPGGGTGHVIPQVKAIGRGDDFQVVEEYVVDTGLVAELRQLEQHTAKELGQWRDQLDISDRPTDELLTELAAIRAARAAHSGRVDAAGAAHGGTPGEPGGTASRSD